MLVFFFYFRLGLLAEVSILARANHDLTDFWFRFSFVEQPDLEEEEFEVIFSSPLYKVSEIFFKSVDAWKSLDRCQVSFDLIAQIVPSMFSFSRNLFFFHVQFYIF